MTGVDPGAAEVLARFGRQVRAVREARGLDLVAAAAEAAVPLVRLEAIEAGRAEADINEVYRLARTLGVDPRRLFPDLHHG